MLLETMDVRPVVGHCTEDLKSWEECSEWAYLDR